VTPVGLGNRGRVIQLSDAPLSLAPLSQTRPTLAEPRPTANESAAVGENASSARDRLLRKLNEIPNDPRFSDWEQKAELQDTYLTWAASVLERREAAFGPEARYELQRNMSVDVAGAMLPAVYDAVRSFISSTSRSPVSNAITTALGNAGEFSNTIDAPLIGGLVGGLTAYAVDQTFLGAMDRLSRLANMPSLKPVDIDALIPEPCTVQLRLSKRDGVTYKVFEPVATDAAPQLDAPVANTSLAALRSTSVERRNAVKAWQNVLNGGSVTSLLQPTLTGLTNMGRRAWLPKGALLDEGQLFAASAFASGTASASGRLAQGVARSLPWVAQANVSNLLGGTQRVNLFVSTRRDPDARAAGFASMVSLPRYVIPLARETVSAGLHAISIPYLHRSWKDLKALVLNLGGIAASNAAAGSLAVALGSHVAQLARKGSLTALPGEAHDSPGALLQQFTQSATSDFTWDLIKAQLKLVDHKVVESLDRRRQTLISQSLKEQASVGRAVMTSLTLSSPGLSRLSAPMREVLSRLRAELNDDGVAGAETLRQARESLKSPVGPDARILGNARRPLLAGTATLQSVASSIEALERLRRGPG